MELERYVQVLEHLRRYSLAEIYQVLQTRLDDFRRFAEHVQKYLEQVAIGAG
ncbi:MAG: hypothetical protein HY335_04145 [Deinococcus sp.]|nr:hypothetical protein [Deinococcus sp.]